MPTVDREFIIAQTTCPVCRASPGEPCVHHLGKGAQKKMRDRVSHFERMQAAQKIAKEMEGDGEALIEP